MSYKAIFLDRDNTLIDDPGYINDPGQVALLEGVPEALREFREMGYKLIVITNQSGVARGIVTEETLERIHERMEILLKEHDAGIDRIYYCPYHPDGVVPKFRKKSDMRKPGPGMLLKAAGDMDLNLATSWVIGDKSSDIEAGLKAGCKTIQIDAGPQAIDSKSRIQPDYTATNIREAVNVIKKHLRCPKEKAPQIPAVKEEPSPVEQAESEYEPVSEDEPSIRQKSVEDLLQEIILQLQKNRREELFGDFSFMRMFAIIIQSIVFLCLLITVSILMRPEQNFQLVFTLLGFSIVLQMMSLTFYLMQRPK